MPVPRDDNRSHVHTPPDHLMLARAGKGLGSDEAIALLMAEVRRLRAENEALSSYVAAVCAGNLERGTCSLAHVDGMPPILVHRLRDGSIAAAVIVAAEGGA